MKRQLWAAYCWFYGHCWLPMPDDIFEPLLCHQLRPRHPPRPNDREWYLEHDPQLCPGGLNTMEKITATYYYPGSFFAEDTTVTIKEPTLAAAVEARPDDRWFAVEIKRTRADTFRSMSGEERVLPLGKPAKVGKWYVGEEFTAEEVEALDGDHHILVSNMRGNRWNTVCRTRCGNWQPVEEGDVVLADAPVPG